MLYLGFGILYLLFHVRAWRTLWFIGVTAISAGLWVFGWCFAALMTWIFNPSAWRAVELLPSWTSQHMAAATTPAGCIGAVFYFPLDILRWTFDIAFNQAGQLGIGLLPFMMVPITALIAFLWWRWLEYALSSTKYSPDKPLVDDMEKSPLRTSMRYDDRGVYND